MQYAPTVLPENTVRFPSPTRTRLSSPASAEALIFFCLLFLYQDKAPTGAGKFSLVHF